MTYYLNKNFVKLEKTFPDQTPVWLGGEKYPSSSSTTTTATKQLLRSWVLMYAQLMVNLISSRIQRHSPIIDHGRPAKRPVGWLGTHSRSKISKTVCLDLFRLGLICPDLSKLLLRLNKILFFDLNVHQSVKPSSAKGLNNGLPIGEEWLNWHQRKCYWSRRWISWNDPWKVLCNVYVPSSEDQLDLCMYDDVERAII